MTTTLVQKGRKAALKYHKRRQRQGLWCEPGCPFHREKTPEEVWKTHVNGWTWAVHDNIDRMYREGYFGADD